MMHCEMWPIKTEVPEPTLSEQLAKIQSFGITAMPVQKKKARAKRVRWGEDETRDMLTLYERFTLTNSTDADVKSQADVCRSVEIEMKKEGFDKSWHQIKDRYTNLRVVYLKSQGMQRSACIGMNSASEFFNQISRIVELEGKHIRIRRTGEGMAKSSVFPSPGKSFDDGINNNSEDSFADENDGTKDSIQIQPKQEFSKDSTIAVPNPEIQSVLHAALMKRKQKDLSAHVKEELDLNCSEKVKQEVDMVLGVNYDARDTEFTQMFPSISVTNDSNDSHTGVQPPRKRKRRKAIYDPNMQPPPSPGDLCQVLIESPMQNEQFSSCGVQRNPVSKEYFLSDEVTLSEVPAFSYGKNPTINRPKKPRAADLEQLIEFLREENLRLRSENQQISDQYHTLASSIITISYLRSMQELALNVTAPDADSFPDLD